MKLLHLYDKTKCTDSQPQTIDKFIKSLPYVLQCSNDFKSEGIRYMNKKDALKKREIQANPKNKVCQIVLDCDYDPAELGDMDIPLPNLITISKRNHFHAVFLLDTPVFNLDSHIGIYLRDTVKKLRQLFNSDKSYAMHMTHNPLAYDTRTLRRDGYTLKELNSYCTHIEIERPTSQNKGSTGDSRNKSIHDTLLKESTTLCKSHKARKNTYKALEQRAFELYEQLEDKSDFKPYEVKSIARSVHKTHSRNIAMWKSIHPYESTYYFKANQTRHIQADKRKGLFFSLYISEKGKKQIQDTLQIKKSTYYSYTKAIKDNVKSYIAMYYNADSFEDLMNRFPKLSKGLYPLLIRLGLSKDALKAYSHKTIDELTETTLSSLQEPIYQGKTATLLVDFISKTLNSLRFGPKPKNIQMTC